MAYGLEPWRIEDWPSQWLHRSLAVLEPVDEAPAFGELAQPATDQPTLPGMG